MDALEDIEAVDATTADALLTMRGYSNANAFFWAVCKDVTRLRAVDRDIAAGVDSMPTRNGGAGHTSGISKPTENRALFLMTEGERWLSELQDQRNELVYIIGCGLVVCEFLRTRLGGKYGNLLETKYIDQHTWSETAEICGLSTSHAKRLGGVALDWLDSFAGVE